MVGKTGDQVTNSALAFLFVTAISLGAFLLFWIEPMFGKMVLPLLGGAPNVWITAMLFFQTLLLAGYGYVHLTSCYMSHRGQVILHLLVMALGMSALPVVVVLAAPFADKPILWIVATMTVSIGLPFFAVSSTAPLIQRWFAATGHRYASDPYFLYAGSNFGSIVALLSFPALFQPFFGLNGQSWAWTAGYGVLIVLIAACGFSLIRNGGEDGAANSSAPGWDFAAVDTRQRLMWIALAFAPSSLMLGVTTRLTTDIAAVPLLWVIPLTLYLLTYVLTFARHKPLRHRWMIRLQPYAMVLGLISIAHVGLWPMLFVDLLVFFVIAMVCHGELVRRRPKASQLTEFYLWMAFGGMLGGVFNAVVAPLLFNGAYEYPIAFVIAALLRPGRTGGVVPTRVRDVALPILLFAVMALIWVTFDIGLKAYSWVGFYLFFVVAGIYLIAFKGRWLRFGLGMAAALVITSVIGPGAQVLDRSRSFFGIYSVISLEDGAAVGLKHGRTLHGAQYRDAERSRQPLTYYARIGPVGQFFEVLDEFHRPRRIGLLGLGVGSMLCYGHPGQQWTVYEIDPLVERIARNTRYFNYLSECMEPSAVEMIHGDARQSLAATPRRRFDLLVLDAFNSDAVPVHLLTREAFALYRDSLNPGGLILLNFSNKFLDLKPVLARLVADAGMHALTQEFVPPFEMIPEVAPANWLIAARNGDELRTFAEDPRWTPLTVEGRGPRLWTDDYSNILSVMRWRIDFHDPAAPWR